MDNNRSMKAGRGARGSILVECLAAVLVMGMVGTAVLVGVSTTHKSGSVVEAQSLAENIVRNQIESVFALAFVDAPTTYPSVTVPAGYGVTATASEYLAGVTDVQKIVVSVTRGGQTLLTVETLRTRS